ncbi:MAG: biliverdin-producing heme oxygenase [Phycisphaerae bacterium]|nr:biliverdin-producing heme oxygenase [Phycisphaerae bacterium]
MTPNLASPPAIPTPHSNGHGHTATPAATDPTASLAGALRSKTHDLHVMAEKHPFQQRLLRGQVSRDELAAYLHELAHVHAALERAFESTAHPIPRSLFRDHHYRSGLAKHDVAALDGLFAELPRTRSAKSFVSAIDDLASADPVSLVGVLYVLEGATNGNVFLARALEQSLGLERRVATSSLDPHGDDQRPRWMAFRSLLDTLSVPEAEAGRIVAAARATFRAVHDIADELAPSRG